jgi:hypothetical protein
MQAPYLLLFNLHYWGPFNIVWKAHNHNFRSFNIVFNISLDYFPKRCSNDQQILREGADCCTGYIILNNYLFNIYHMTFFFG